MYTIVRTYLDTFRPYILLKYRSIVLEVYRITIQNMQNYPDMGGGGGVCWDPQPRTQAFLAQILSQSHGEK